MPGAMRKMGVYLGLVEDDELAENDVYERADDRYAARTPARRDEYSPETRYPSERYAAPEPRFAEPRYDFPPAHQPADAHAHADPTEAYRITTLHPRTYNEARDIGENFRKGTPVIMNLSEMDDSDAKRLVDFAAGLTFGLHGRIERVTTKVFLLIPRNVTLTAQDKAKIAEGGFFNQS